MQSHEIQKYILNPSSVTAIVEYMSEKQKQKVESQRKAEESLNVSFSGN